MWEKVVTYLRVYPSLLLPGEAAVKRTAGNGGACDPELSVRQLTAPADQHADFGGLASLAQRQDRSVGRVRRSLAESSRTDHSRSKIDSRKRSRGTAI